MRRLVLYLLLVAAIPALLFLFVTFGLTGNDILAELARWSIPGVPDPIMWILKGVAALFLVVIGQRALAFALGGSRASRLCNEFRRTHDQDTRRDLFRMLTLERGQHALFLVARWGLGDWDQAINELALVRLIEAHLDALVPLCKALDDSQFSGRSEAYGLLGALGRPAVPYLQAACAGGERHPQARSEACSALAAARAR